MKNIYFVHIPKVAGISIKQAFLNKYMFNGTNLFNSNVTNPNLKKKLREYAKTKTYNTPVNIGNDNVIHFGKHENIYEKVKDVTPKFCFSFVRNPWDRLVSIYFYCQQENYFQPEMMFADFIRMLYENQDFPQELDEIFFQPEALVDMNTKGLVSQVDYLSDPQGNLYTDFIGRFENLQKDFDKLCELIGVEPITLKVVNTSRHPSYRNCYSKESEMMVREIYEKDVKKFGYAF